MAGRDDDGFLSRWARRKAQVRSGATADAAREPADKAVGGSTAAPARFAIPSPPPATTPTADVAQAGGRSAAPAAPLAGLPATSGTSPAPSRDPVAAPGAQAPSSAGPAAPDRPQPAPTLDDVAELTPASDFRRFVHPDVDPGVRNAALKKLFAAPEFNVMDGLDVYIDDYSVPSPLPASMLRKLAHAAQFGLVDPPPPPPGAVAASPGTPSALPQGSAPAVPESAPVPDAPSTTNDSKEGTAAGATAGPAPRPTHEDTDLRLQPDDAAGPEGPGPGAGPDPGRER